MKKVYTTKSGKNITVYDDVYPYDYREDMNAYALTSNYRIGWSDQTHLLPRSENYLHSGYSDEDLLRSNTYQTIEKSEVAPEFEGMKMHKSILNLSVPSDSHYPHVHTDVDRVYLYYVNLDWNPGWHGETLFYNDSLEEIEYAFPYKPGRVVVFDGNIPHSIRPQSYIADKHRLTLTIMLNKN